MPFTRTRAWRLTFPRLYDWGVRYATIESMNDNWHFQVPGNYVLARVLWDVDTDVDALLDEFYTRYYGDAAESMRRYNTVLEDAYEGTHAYAGNLWSMHRILTPDAMHDLHRALDGAEKAVRRDDLRARRVGIARVSLTFADRFLAAREALNRGDLAEAAEQSAAFKANYDEGSKAYPSFIGKRAWGYYRTFHHRSFADAGRVAEEGTVVYAFPNEWAAFLDKNGVGFEDRFYSPEYDTSTWPRFTTYGVSLDEQGYPFYHGTIWYRHDFELPRRGRKARRLILWFGAVDDTAQVYLNGELVGKVAPGNFGPGELDVTEHIDRTGRNALVVAVTNKGITELGTGGICRPVFLYAPRETAATGTGEGEADAGAQKPLFGGDVK